ncbi:MAG: hypothetical protein H6613_13080 [Ignavibacteriales bacterium]|nr:hypothetical protein [Ignavibacteriota bacterium]MCB9249402.1 hypothetical protein [Ignavibacteriales bacterium]
MEICKKVKEIIKTSDGKAFRSLIEFLKFTNCKSEAEIRAMFFACGMSPEKYDLLKQQINSTKN